MPISLSGWAPSELYVERAGTDTVEWATRNKGGYRRVQTLTGNVLKRKAESCAMSETDGGREVEAQREIPKVVSKAGIIGTLQP